MPMLIRHSEETVVVHVPRMEEIDAELNLGVIAYESVHAPVFNEWLRLPLIKKQQVLLDRYVFYSWSCCVGAYVGELIKHDFAEADRFVADTLDYVKHLIEAKISFTEEWFKGIDRLVGDFTNLNFIAEARTLVAIGLSTGVKKFPGLAQSLTVHAAFLDALIGRREKAAKVGLRLVQSPYLLPNRRELPTLCQKLMYVLAAGNHLWEYRLVLWTGVNLLQANYAQRDIFSVQIAKTYRGALRALIAGDVSLKYRIPFALSILAQRLSTIGLDKPIRWAHLGLLFLLDRFFIRKNELFREANRLALNNEKVFEQNQTKWRMPIARFGRRRAPRILVTRAMGGIGDILMMTPGLRALGAKYPRAQIDFAIPKSFHPILEGMPGVRLLDIHEDTIKLYDYKRWINLTDCPAGRVESRQYPNVKRNRIEIFAKAMGISKWRLKFGTGFIPFYKVQDAEREWAHIRMKELNPNGLPIVGLQPYSADSYKNWPYMEELAKQLAENHCVLIFHHEPHSGFKGRNIHKIIEPLRRSIALVSLCNRLVVVDSSFLHFSAPLGVSTIAIFGPTSGKVFCRYYSNVNYLTPSKPAYPCYPCWRNEHKPCHLTNGRESICLRSISVEQVLAALKETSVPSRNKTSLMRRIVDWARYGRE